jgi:hypothetical protein
MISTTGNTSDIIRSFFSLPLVCQVFTCTFDAFQFNMATISGMSISLAVCTSSNIPFVFGWFEFYFALLYIFYIEFALIIRGRFQFCKIIFPKKESTRNHPHQNVLVTRTQVKTLCKQHTSHT